MKEIGSILIYRLTALDQIERDRFCRELLGRTVKTHQGKYTHRIEGLLDIIPHIRVGRGILIVKRANRRGLSDFFRNRGVEDIFIRDIILTKTDIRKLNDEKQN